MLLISFQDFLKNQPSEKRLKVGINVLKIFNPWMKNMLKGV